MHWHRALPTCCLPLSRLYDQLRAKLQQLSAAPQPSANGGGALVTVSSTLLTVSSTSQHAVNDSQLAGGAGPSQSEAGEGENVDPQELGDVSEMLNDPEFMKTPQGEALLATLMDVASPSSSDEQGSDEGPSSSDEPPTKRLRTEEPPEEPPVDTNSFLTSDPNAYRGGLGASDDAAAVPADGYRGLGGTDEEPQQWQSMGASDQEPAPAFRSLGADDEPVLRSAAAPAPAAVEVAPSPRRRAPAAPPLAPPLRAVAMTTLKAIAREMLRQRREKGAAAAAAASSMAEELEDLRQWIRFHRGSDGSTTALLPLSS